jgi:ABC-2 type transport system ATP-binding protein
VTPVAPAEPVIEIEGLKKSFRSRLRRREVAAVRDVSLRIPRGSVVAFVGPNGAGKTTTIYALLGLVRPDSGSIRLLGQPAGSIEARRRVGFQAEIFYTYGFKTAERVLSFYAQLSEVPNAAIREAVARQLARLGLSQAADRKVRGFSKGMMQRLGLAQALLHAPELLILDEPTTGLDPEGRKLVAEIILEEKARGATVFLSSHILSDVERTCDHVIMLNQGSIVFSESMTTVRSTLDEWDIEVLSFPETAREAVAGAAEMRIDGSGGIIVRCKSADKDGLMLRMLQGNAKLGAVRRAHSLEDLYMRYAGGSSDG